MLGKRKRYKQIKPIQCANCGYPIKLAKHSSCPYCGTPVRHLGYFDMSKERNPFNLVFYCRTIDNKLIQFSGLAKVEETIYATESIHQPTETYLGNEMYGDVKWKFVPNFQNNLCTMITVEESNNEKK